MTLNKKQTACLRAALADQSNFLYWLHEDENIFTETIYNALRSNFLSWQSAYNENPSNLYGTNQDNSGTQFSGIDSFPIPPSKN